MLQFRLTSGFIVCMSQIGKNGSKMAIADDVIQIAKITNSI